MLAFSIRVFMKISENLLILFYGFSLFLIKPVERFFGNLTA